MQNMSISYLRNDDVIGCKVVRCSAKILYQFSGVVISLAASYAGGTEFNSRTHHKRYLIARVA